MENKIQKFTKYIEEQINKLSSLSPEDDADQEFYKDTDILIEHYRDTKSTFLQMFDGTEQNMLDATVSLKLADILKVLDDEEYTVAVLGNDEIDSKITESIANNAIIDFKKQLTKELLSKFSS